MKITKLDHLANIEINMQNCDEIIAESLELMKQASSLKLKKMESEERSRRIKSGMANKREQRRLLGANR
jgi:hypothetical protein